MALTALQRKLCRLVAANRTDAGEKYVAGGAALNEIIASARISRDLDLFHDTDEAVAASWDADRHLEAREQPSVIDRVMRLLGLKESASA